MPLAENIAWQLWFVVQFCFLFNSSLKIKSSISLLNSITKNSDWSSALRKSHLRTLKKALFNFQFVYYGYWQIWKPLNKVQTSNIKKIIPAYFLLPLAENIAWQVWLVVQFCFLFNSSLNSKSPISLLDSTIENSDWSSALRQSHLRTLKKIALFKFQFVYYGYWQIWKPLNKVQTSKIKKINPAYFLLPLAENIAWQIGFVVQFCFLFNSSLNSKSSISLLNSITKNSDWSSALRQSHLRTFRKALFNFQFVYYGYWQIWKPLKKVQTSKIKKIIPAYFLLPLAENIAWQLWFVVQFCFLFNSSLKIKSSISLLNSITKNSDWSSALRKSHLRTLKKALFNFQFVYYGSWQIWKPLNRVQTSKIKKIPAYSLLPYAENIAWQLWFVQFCFLFNSSLKFKSPISLLDSTIKKSDW